MSASRQAAVLLGGIVLALAVISAIAILGNTRPGARADILGPRRVEPGERVEYTVSVRDTKGRLRRVEFDYGDGERAVRVARDSGSCDRPTTADVDLHYTYERQGIFTARARVTTGGCGAATETVEAIRTIRVRPLRS